MENTTVYYMSQETGSVDTAANWAMEGYDITNHDLIPVERDADGEWIVCGE